jgi:hypothetical protein
MQHILRWDTRYIHTYINTHTHIYIYVYVCVFILISNCLTWSQALEPSQQATYPQFPYFAARLINKYSSKSAVFVLRCSTVSFREFSLISRLSLSTPATPTPLHRTDIWQQPSRLPAVSSCNLLIQAKFRYTSASKLQRVLGLIILLVCYVKRFIYQLRWYVCYPSYSWHWTSCFFSMAQHLLVGSGRLVVAIPISHTIRHTHTHSR